MYLFFYTAHHSELTAVYRTSDAYEQRGSGHVLESRREPTGRR